MSQTFWQTRLPMRIEPLRAMAQAFDPALQMAIDQGVSDLAVIELIRDTTAPGRMALLISVESASSKPNDEGRDDLTCWMAFANDQYWCNNFRTHGIPMIEARIVMTEDGEVQVHAPGYPMRSMERPLVLRNQHVLTLKGVDLQTNDESPISDAWTPTYRQFRSAPDIALQTTDVSVTHFSWSPLRRSLREPDGAGVHLEVEPSAWPALAAVLCPDGSSQASSGFCRLQAGRFVDTESVFARPPEYADLKPPFTPWKASAAEPPPVTRLATASVFGAPHFEFDDVDVVGFRLTLPQSAMPKLQALIAPLNFHRSEDGAMDDFSWRVATPTISVELLHYGKMRTRAPYAPLRPEDYMSQHELLVRVLVGKVDDDGSQAREASLFVPTIFVDNPWSKLVGRESQGFPKELAQFCIRDEAGTLRPLDMAGRHDDVAHPLVKVVHLRTPPSFHDDASHPLMDLRYPVNSGEDSQFERVDLNAILGTPVPGFSRWRQSDFGEREFRRSFARQAMASGFNGFSTVQATPVDDRSLPPAWICGNMKITSMRALFPPGIASLTLSSKGRPPHGARPDAWRMLCDVLGEEEISLPSGDWYRLKMNLEMSVRNSLDW